MHSKIQTFWVYNLFGHPVSNFVLGVTFRTTIELYSISYNLITSIVAFAMLARQSFFLKLLSLSSHKLDLFYTLSSSLQFAFGTGFALGDKPGYSYFLFIFLFFSIQVVCSRYTFNNFNEAPQGLYISQVYFCKLCAYLLC